MSDLKQYKAKRRFGVTTEPEGIADRSGSTDPVFVVQKHAARRLHYDLRLEIDGALKSWAVPEGPCLDSKVRRLAVHVEDHPLDYADFEGRIPSGEYGAGGVIVWDRGTWVTLADDPLEALAAGELKFRLAGEKLRGGWTLVRLARDPKNWLLIKERDDAVRPLAEYDVLVEEPLSVLSGLAVEDLNLPERAPVKPAAKAVRPGRIRGAKKADLPGRVSPQLASKADAAPEGEGWLHEIKYDGYRTIVRIDGEDVRLFTRNKHDWTHRYRALADAFRRLTCKSAIIDGEVTVQDPRGVTSIALLENALADGRDQDLTFFAFDLLYLDGYDLTAAPLVDRKAALAGLIAPHADARAAIQLSEHFEGGGAELFAHATRMGLEGVVSKRADAPYVQGRTKTWLKVKRGYVGDFIVIGYTTSAASPIAALILADEGPDGGLAYVGRVTFGIAESIAAQWRDRLRARQIDESVIPVPKTPGATFTEPSAVARVAFNSRAPDGAPRQPVLVGLSPYRKPAPSTKPKLITDRDLAAIRLTNPDREMFGTSGLTKLDIAVYYARVGDWMLPELLRRPMSLIRCPSGALEDCFYQRHAFAGLPPGISTIGLSDEQGRADFIYAETAQGFLGLTQFGAIEFHPWGCRIDDPEHPDRFIVDLDPDPALPWPFVRAAAEQLRERLKDLGFEPFLRLTGGKGLHLVMALAPGCDWPTLRAFAEAFARTAAEDAPRVFTSAPGKDRRAGRIYLDYLRNYRGSSAIASYSLRANENFTVAAPVAWDELRALPGPRAFNQKGMLQRLSRLAKDPWEGLESSASEISRKARLGVGMKS